VLERWPDARVVHRLDMSTSGLMLFARGAAAQRALGRAFEAREVHKRYLAVVAGLVAADSGSIDAPLAADWPRRPRQRVDHASGRAALTHWRVIERDSIASTTRLALEPVTGRSHQLRVHLLHIGHPIVGDALYAPEHAAPRPVAHAAQRLMLHAAQRLMLHAAQRLMLHAAALRLRHPISSAWLEIEAPLPF
jgi:tRNA pseudouridine32 synthase / 23S rRNA pseudouridine746 synthase